MTRFFLAALVISYLSFPLKCLLLHILIGLWTRSLVVVLAVCVHLQFIQAVKRGILLKKKNEKMFLP